LQKHEGGRGGKYQFEIGRAGPTSRMNNNNNIKGSKDVPKIRRVGVMWRRRKSHLKEEKVLHRGRVGKTT